jgi:hypothetical protein
LPIVEMDGVNMQETFFLFRSCVRRSKRVSKTQTAGREGHELQTGYLDCVQQMPSDRRASRVDSGMTTATDLQNARFCDGRTAVYTDGLSHITAEHDSVVRARRLVGAYSLWYPYVGASTHAKIPTIDARLRAY